MEEAEAVFEIFFQQNLTGNRKLTKRQELILINRSANYADPSFYLIA